ncbi:hypothetical protein [Vibrio antiquarius]|uniref:hypothetical protein n=1 Tax=Vibrio antiquarius (strain Ex25) TaxID=150340 RepID=UPI002659FDBF|nr:hypothetical protein [Vibrio antiquarius]MCR9988651.1 hypothetical protein [Vibrio antiquarius]
MNKEQVDAVAQVLQLELKREGKKSFYLGLIVNFVFFILGAGTSYAISASL